MNIPNGVLARLILHNTTYSTIGGPVAQEILAGVVEVAGLQNGKGIDRVFMAFYNVLGRV